MRISIKRLEKSFFSLVAAVIFVSASSVVNAQSPGAFQILLEGTYPIDGDSALYSKLEWYGFYVSEPNKRGEAPNFDTFEKVQLKIEYNPKYDGRFSWRTSPSVISTTNRNKSLFLLGVQRGTQLNFASDYRCGATTQYGYYQSALLPGRWVNRGFPTMSCNYLSIYATGNVAAVESNLKLTDYRIFVELPQHLVSSPTKRTQEITDDILKNPKSVWHEASSDVPYIYATGDFDFDALNDFILWHNGIFYLYLTRYATGKEIVGLVAKSKLQKTTDKSDVGLPESLR